MILRSTSQFVGTVEGLRHQERRRLVLGFLSPGLVVESLVLAVEFLDVLAVRPQIIGVLLLTAPPLVVLSSDA